MHKLVYSPLKYIVLLSLGVQFCFTASAQEVLFEKAINLKKGLNGNREAYPVMDIGNQKISLFLIDKQTIKGHLFDKNLQLTDTLDAPRPSGAYEVLMGSNISAGRYNLFFAQSSNADFAVVSFDFNNNKIDQQLIALPMKKEKYVGSGSHKGKFFMFTVLRATSTLKLYVFDDHTNYTSHTYNFEKEHFGPDVYTSLADLLRLNPLVFIDNDVPNAIELVSRKNKLYGYQNKLAITLDNQANRTALITIDIATFESGLAFYEHPKSKYGDFVTPNSYLYKDHLYQFVACPSEMILSVKSLSDGTRINEFVAGAEEEIYFKNSSIVQEASGLYGVESEKELSKTRQFLRKVSGSDAGVSVYETSAGLEMVLGGCKQLQWGSEGSSGMPMGAGTMNTPYGSAPISTLVYNPTFNGYNAYKVTKSVHFKSLLNSSTFDHIKGEIPENIFDKVQAFTKTLEENVTAETLFKKDNACVLGYYFKPNGHYILRVFYD